MNPPQRVAIALGVLALLLAFCPYDVCGAAVCSVVYAAYNQPLIIEAHDGGRPDGGLLAAQLPLVLLTATAVVALERPLGGLPTAPGGLQRALVMTARDEVNRAEQFPRPEPAMGQNQAAVTVAVARVLAECGQDLRGEATRLWEEAARLREEARRLREEAVCLRP